MMGMWWGVADAESEAQGVLRGWMPVLFPLLCRGIRGERKIMAVQGGREGERERKRERERGEKRECGCLGDRQ